MDKKTEKRLEILIEYMVDLLGIEEDWPRKPALEYGIPIGTIACPHCGVVVSGVIDPICPMCEQSWWEGKKIEWQIDH